MHGYIAGILRVYNDHRFCERFPNVFGKNTSLYCGYIAGILFDRDLIGCREQRRKHVTRGRKLMVSILRVYCGHIAARDLIGCRDETTKTRDSWPRTRNEHFVGILWVYCLRDYDWLNSSWLTKYVTHHIELVVSILGVYCEYIVLGDYDWLNSSWLIKHVTRGRELVVSILWVYCEYIVWEIMIG